MDADAADDPRGDAPARGGRGWLVVVLLVVASTLVRVLLTVGDPAFDAEDPRGLLRSDPAELAYLAGRVEGSGGAPEDWRADPRVVAGDSVDVPATYTVGQEWLLLAAARVAPGAAPHVRALWVSSLTASLVLVGLFGALLVATRSRRAALLGAGLWALTPAAYRTVGFLYVREDLALPLFALAGWATVAAARRSSPARWAAAGALLGVTLGAWHGAVVAGALLGVGLVIAALRVERAPRGAWAGLVALVVVLVAIPATRSRAAMLGPAVQLAAAALAIAATRRGAPVRAVAGAAVVIGLTFAQRAVAGDDLAHVTALLTAKIEHLGALPDDPRALAPDVRLMWQGPFATFPIGAMIARLGVLLVGVGLVLGVGATRRAHAPWAIASLAAVVLAWLAQRNMAIATPILVVASALAVASSPRRVVLVRGALLLQGLAFFVWLVTFQVHWFRPLDQVAARRAAVEATAERVPDGATVLADSLIGPALLADHDRPIALQAKWETKAARDRVVRFLDRLYAGSIGEFVAYQREEVGAEWLLFDGHTLWALGATRYAAGLPPRTSLPPPGSALSVLLGVEGDLETHYEVVWRESDAVGRAGTGRTGLWLGRAR